MRSRSLFLSGFFTVAIFLANAFAGPTTVVAEQTPAQHTESGWQVPARWRHGISSKTSGTLALTDVGVEFRPTKGESLVWRFEEIQTFHATPRQLELKDYQNRRWHFHGEKHFQFDLEAEMPSSVAATLAARVGKPSANGLPNPNAPSFAELGARHRTRGGGTNGTLRFRESGIDYVTNSGAGARSWRWADIQTISRRDAFHFSVGAFRETFDFELKEPMSRALFERLWDEVYTRGLIGLRVGGGEGQ